MTVGSGTAPIRRLVAGGVALWCAAVTFAPWLRSGSSRRSSYGVVRAARDLDVLDGWAQPAAAAAWYFVPLLAALALLAVTLDRPVLWATLLGVTGTSVGLLGVKLTIGAFSAEWGSYAGVAGGTVAVAAAAEAIIHERRNRERRRTPGADVVA